jgi:hypothetical protein
VRATLARLNRRGAEPLHDPKTTLRSAVEERGERFKRRKANEQRGIDFLQETVIPAFSAILRAFQGTTKVTTPAFDGTNATLTVKDQVVTDEFAYTVTTTATAEGAFIAVEYRVHSAYANERVVGTGTGNNIEELSQESIVDMFAIDYADSVAIAVP